MSLLHRAGFATATLLAITMAWLATQQGIGLSPDSAYYIGGARSLMQEMAYTMPAGGGVERAITWYPPLYSAFLALSGLCDADPHAAARPVHVVMYAVNVLLMGMLARRLSDGSAVAGLLAALLTLCAPSILQVHTMVWSESLFISLCLCSAMMGLTYATAGRMSTLLALGILTAMTFLTRYVGLVNIGIGAVAVVLVQSGKLKTRMHRGFVLLLGLLPALLWLHRNHAVSATATGRAISWHPYSWEQASDTLTVLSSWLLPWRLAAPSAGLLVLTAVCGIHAFSVAHHLRHVRHSPRSPVSVLILTLIAYELLYCLFVVATISLAAAKSSLDDRLLSPVLLITILILSDQLTRWLTGPSHVLRRAVMVVLLVAMCCAGLRIGLTTRALAARGQGYATATFRNSATLDVVSNLPADLLLLSNGPDVIYLYTGRPAGLLPAQYDMNTQKADPNWRRTLESMAQRHDVVFVWFDHVMREAMPSKEDMKRLRPGNLVLQLSDGFLVLTDDTKSAQR
jgi:4-amino-4-deoxy-L-arabinose transferase-like glycosyltransferase